MAGTYVNKAVLLCVFFKKDIGGLMAGRPCKTLMDIKVSVLGDRRKGQEEERTGPA